MELGSYQNKFAALDWANLEDFSQLPIDQLFSCVTTQRDRDSLESGLQELQHFLAFRDGTAALLEQLGADRYSELFALHGVSVQMVPYLTELHLECMGITSAAERKRALAVISSLGQLGGGEAQAPAQLMLGGLQPSQLGSSFPGWHQRPTGRIPSTSTPGIGDTRTVDEWLRFINGAEASPGKKKRKRKRKKKKKKTTQEIDAAIPDQGEVGTNNGAPTEMEVAAWQPAVSSSLATDPVPPASEPDHADGDAKGVEEAKGVEKVLTNNQEVLTDDHLVGDQEPVKVMALPEALLLGDSLKEATELEPSPDWRCEPHVPLTFETSHLSGLEPAKPARHDPFSPELMPLEELLQNDEFSDEDDMDPVLKAQLDAEVEEFRRRLESTHSKSKLTPIFFLPD